MLRWPSALLACWTVLALSEPAFAGVSNSLLDLSPDGSRLLVTNRDNGTVSVVDTASERVLHEVAVGELPEGVTWVGNGPLAAVTVYAEDRVVFFDAVAGKVVARLTVADEPYGIVANRDGTRAWVTQEYPGTVTELDLQQQRVVRELKAGSFPRGICLSPDEGRLYVTEYYTAALNALDLKTGQLVDRWQGQTTDNLCRNVVVHPRRPKAYLSHLRSRIDIADGRGSIFPQLSVCDLIDKAEAKARGDRPQRRISFAMDTYNGVYVVANPWEAALSPDGTKLYTVYAGTNDMNLSRVVDDDYNEITRVGRARAIGVGQNPRAVRVSPDGKKVYVYNTLDFAVGVYAGDDMKKLSTVKVCDPPKSPEWVRGKILFNTAEHPMTSRRWIACSSCHPDGHTDGRVWQNPEGLRKTTALFGVAHTHPLHWSADRDEVQDFEYTIRGRLMQGRGLLNAKMKAKDSFDPAELDEVTSGRSADLDALAVYSNSFEFTLSPHAAGPGKLTAAAERGRQLFFSNEVGCATCHSGPYYTDSTLQKPYRLHDVGTGRGDPSEKMGTKYDTPSLLGVYRTPPYLHDGTAATLRDVLTTCNPEDKHGKTSQLKASEIDDLVEFVKSLPYDKPPSETANAVKYRLQPARKE